MLDVLDLLAQDQLDKSCMRLVECLEVALATEIKRTDATQARRSRAFDHMVADREHPRGRDDAEQAGLLQVKPPLFGPNGAEHPDRRFDRACGIGEKLREGGFLVGGRERFTPQCFGEACVTMDTAQIEEDVD